MTTRTANRTRGTSAMNQMNYLSVARRELIAAVQATPLIQSLIGGHPDIKSYETFLTNTWHCLRHNSAVTGLAAIRCTSIDATLADYFFRRAQEDLGCERGTAADLATLGITERDLLDSKPAPGCAAMIGYEYYVAGHCHPASLFGWLYMLEALNEDLGPIISTQLSQAFPPSTGVRFVRAHGKAEKFKTWELTEQIMEHVNPLGMAEINHAADVVSKLYLGIFDQSPAKERIGPARAMAAGSR